MSSNHTYRLYFIYNKYDLIHAYIFQIIFIILVNTLGAELLYSEVGRWCSATKDSVVLDICCGTGTIGLTIAKVKLFFPHVAYDNNHIVTCK